MAKEDAGEGMGPARATAVSVGWDVAGWQSPRQAVAVASLDPGGGLRWPVPPTLFRFPPGRPPRLGGAAGSGMDPAAATRLEAALAAERCVVAVDAPLGFPAGFRWFLHGEGPAPEVPHREIDNPLAYRACDRWVHRRHGRKPLSAAFDRLGTNATLALAVVASLRDDGFRLVPGDGDGDGVGVGEGPPGPPSGGPLRLPGKGPQRCVIEVYPALVKSTPRKEAPALEPFRRLLPSGVEPGTDAYDAALCALLGLAYLGGEAAALPGLVGPREGWEGEEPLDLREGWIFAP